MTRLEAVNTILSGLGETAIDELTEPLPADIAQAVNMLDRVTEEIQLVGWHFNTDENYMLLPDTEGEIRLPADVHRVTFKDRGYRYVNKNGRLYDPENGTYKIAREVRCDIVRILPFEKLPLAFQHYASVRAARKYQNNFFGSDSIRSFQESDEMEARFACLKEEQAIRKPAMQGSGFLGGWSVAQTLRR